MLVRIAIAALLAVLPLASQQTPKGRKTVVGISGPKFTINGRPTYSAAQGFPNADPRLEGTLLNVRAVQAIFDDANYPRRGSRANPYPTEVMGPVFFDYPDGKWDPDRNVNEFIAALPDWRRCGLLAFTVNLQGGGPTDGNYGGDQMQPHDNSGFDAEGNLKPAYARRLEKVIAAADDLGMVAIVGLFYFGENERVPVAPDSRYVRKAITDSAAFLKSLPYRNVLIEINNEASAGGYRHSILQPNGIVEAVSLAQQTLGKEIPVSMSWSGGLQPAGSPGDKALRAVDYVMFHTNGKTPEQVRTDIAAMRQWVGKDRPLMINEDGVSAFNLHAAVADGVGWGFYDQGWNDYVHGFQSPPTNWRINTPVKWLFFEQVARLSGSPVPPQPKYESKEDPVIHMVGLSPNQVVKGRIWVEAVVEDRHPRWPIKRVEFYLDGKPYNYLRNAPYFLGGREWWSPPASLSAGKHVLRVAAFDMRGPRYSESCSILEVPFMVER